MTQSFASPHYAEGLANNKIIFLSNMFKTYVLNCRLIYFIIYTCFNKSGFKSNKVQQETLKIFSKSGLWYYEFNCRVFIPQARRWILWLWPDVTDISLKLHITPTSPSLKPRLSELLWTKISVCSQAVSSLVHQCTQAPDLCSKVLLQDE